MVEEAPVKRTRKRATAAEPAPAPEPVAKPAPKPAVPAMPGLRRTLEQGDRGPHIIAVQERLTALGHYDGKISGLYGYQTVRAVRRLQGAHGLRPSGVIDARTWDALYK